MDWDKDFSAAYPSEYAEMLLDEFSDRCGVTSKGKLSVVVQLTRVSADRQFPLDPHDFLTENRGQVANLGGGFLKKILESHGIAATLSREGGRTSRGSVGLAESYLDLLNVLWEAGCCDFYGIENYWIDRVRRFLEGKPFRLSSERNKTVSALVDDLFAQARKRQAVNPGTQYVGTVLQHLVAAKLQIILPNNQVEVHGADVADAPTGRSGDFIVGDTVIHCTTAPGDPLMEKCGQNIAAGCHPVIVTIQERVISAMQMAGDRGFRDQIDVWDVQQFLSTNVSEHSLFDGAQRNQTIAHIIDNYNAIIDLVETDKSLKIDFQS